MRNINLFVSLMIGIALILGGCHAGNTAKGSAIGGAEAGAGVGALPGDGKEATWGVGTGAIVGGAAGALIGNKMDKQKKELEKIKDAQVESVNDGQAIKVTFDSGILFATNSSTLNRESGNSLALFANSLKSNPDTNVHIYGHIDSTGGDNINIPLSNQRAGSVENFLSGQGIPTSRMTSEGFGSSQPVADNGTTVGRQQNRRVEIYIVPNRKMIQEVQSGSLE